MRLEGLKYTDEEMEEAYKILVETPERIKPLGRHTSSRKDNIVINFEVMAYYRAEQIYLERHGSIVGPL
jgi:hypothetical protein